MLKKIGIFISILLISMCAVNTKYSASAKDSKCSITIELEEGKVLKTTEKDDSCGNIQATYYLDKTKYVYSLSISGFKKEVKSNNTYTMVDKDTGKEYKVLFTATPSEKWYKKITKKINKGKNLSDIEFYAYDLYSKKGTDNSSFYSQNKQIALENNKENHKFKIKDLSVSKLKEMYENKELTFSIKNGYYYVFYYDENNKYIEKQITPKIAEEIGVIKGSKVENTENLVKETKNLMTKEELTSATKKVKKNIEFSKTETTFIVIISLLILLLIVVIIFEKKSKNRKNT